MHKKIQHSVSEYAFMSSTYSGIQIESQTSIIAQDMLTTGRCRINANKPTIISYCNNQIHHTVNEIPEEICTKSPEETSIKNE